MAIGLKFDTSPAGQLEGINDAGIETFAGHRFSSLAREQAQNSLDAKAEGAQGPVEVEYEVFDIDAEQLPGGSTLASCLRLAEKFWSEEGRVDAKALKLIKNARRLLRRGTIPILRISDRNTKGLRNSDLELRGDWYSLTKGSGVSLKREGAGGSFGIGKNVFWLNSGLRTVFFATHDVDDKWAFQGVSKWVSYKTSRGDISRAVGFYGEETGFAPIRGKRNIPPRFRPEGVGTDIYIAGFDPEDSWVDDLSTAFLRNFFVAFHDDLLRVRIMDREISSANVAGLIADLASRNQKKFTDLKNYFDALTAADARTFEREFDELGSVSLRLLARDGARKKVAMFRGTGMTIFERGGFRTPLEFAGVFRCHSDRGNEYLRRLEPPSHNAWEHERSDTNPREAKRVLSDLDSWLRDCVKEFSPSVAAPSVSVPDLEKFLPDETDDPFDSGVSIVEGDPIPPPPTLLEGRVKKDRRKPDLEILDNTGGDADGEEEGDGEGSKKGDGKPNGGSKSSGGGGDELPGLKEIPVASRVFKRPGGPGDYFLSAEVPRAGKCWLEVSAFGDDGRTEPVRVLLARPDLSGVGDYPVHLERRIGPIELEAPGRLSLLLQLDTARPLSLRTKVMIDE